MRFQLLLCACPFVLAAAPASNRLPDPAVREAVRVARTIARDASAAIWPALSDAPLQLLLVDGDEEYLFCPEPNVDLAAEGFDALALDPLTGCEVAARERSYAADTLATMAAVGGVSTVVAGMPDATGYDLPAWTATLLHEHVHQMQASTPGYNAGAAALARAAGHATGGRWMLTYPFPYEDRVAGAGYRLLASRALSTLKASDADFEVRLAAYTEARRAVLAALAPEDARYMELQLWQEGAARWSETALVEAAGPLWPYEADWAEGAWEHVLRELAGAELALDGRAAFYPLGAAEAAMLERAGGGWRARFLVEPFAMESYFPAKPPAQAR